MLNTKHDGRMDVVHFKLPQAFVGHGHAGKHRQKKQGRREYCKTSDSHTDPLLGCFEKGSAKTVPSLEKETPEKPKEKKFSWFYKGEEHNVYLNIPDALYQRYKNEKPHDSGYFNKEENAWDLTAYVMDEDDDIIMQSLADQLNQLAKEIKGLEQ